MKPFALLAGLGTLGVFLYGAKKGAAATIPSSPPQGPYPLPGQPTPPAPNPLPYVPAPAPTTDGTLREGMRGTAVAEWQVFLGISADGIFGPETTLATKLFQASKGLAQDGVVGPATRAAARLPSSGSTSAPVVSPVLTGPPSGYVAARPTPLLEQVAASTLAFGDPVGTSYPFESDGKKYLAVVTMDGGKKVVAIYQPENQA